MIKVSLDGKWKLSCLTENIVCDATVPGCNFTDLQAAGIIPDSFIACNEKQVQWVGEKDWVYEKTFSIDKDFLAQENQILVFDMLDTLAEVYLNQTLLGKTANVYRQYKFDIKGIVSGGKNSLRIVFRSPLPYIKGKQRRRPLPNLTEGEAGSCYIRKPAYHFGWDWAPHLLSCGITKHVYLKAYRSALENVGIKQIHQSHAVYLQLTPEISGAEQSLALEYTLICPDGAKYEYSCDDKPFTLQIDNPRLWWCNGLGEQQLYTLKSRIKGEDWLTYYVGLRTIVLDRSKDEYGSNFRFIVNGVAIFASGANWVPTDSFIARTSREKLEQLIIQAKRANMNMLRVWGGGYYESDDFYALCDKYGILVWQDCMYACSAYPYSDKDFIEECMAETEYNVKRLRHHSSLALWCGNNEIEAMSGAWFYRPDVIIKAKPFFYKTLAQKIASYDDSTPYHPGSPSGDGYLRRVNSDGCGDTHLWKVWHGMRPLEHLSKRKTRFCSEFGLQSFPNLNTLKRINEGSLPEGLDSAVMKVHQKAVLGNSRAQYYVAKSFFLPEKLWDMTYLTQLCQAKCAEYATQFWRTNKGRCNGALYWQYNDCWGVTSWAGRDYYGNLKAVQYRAAHFNSPLCVTVLPRRNKVDVYLINDTLVSGRYKAEYGLQMFDGKILSKNVMDIDVNAQSIIKLGTLRKSDVNSSDRKHTVVYAEVKDIEDNIVSERKVTWKKENKSHFTDSGLEYKTALSGKIYTIEISAKAFAYGVELTLDGIDCVFSDNYFDLLANRSKKVCVETEGKTKEELDKLLNVRSLYDVKRAKYGKIKDFGKKAAVFLHPFNFGNWLYRTFE